MKLEADVGVHRVELFRGRLELGAADVRRVVERLAMEVGEVDGVVVHETDRSDARGREVGDKRAAKPADADAQDASGLEFGLAFGSDLGEEGVAAVTDGLFLGDPLIISDPFGGSF